MQSFSLRLRLLTVLNSGWQGWENTFSSLPCFSSFFPDGMLQWTSASWLYSQEPATSKWPQPAMDLMGMCVCLSQQPVILTPSFSTAVNQMVLEEKNSKQGTKQLSFFYTPNVACPPTLMAREVWDLHITLPLIFRINHKWLGLQNKRGFKESACSPQGIGTLIQSLWVHA